MPYVVSCNDVSSLFCAGVTVYRALRHAKIQPGQRLAVFGVGGLGHLAVQIGQGLGATVSAIDVSEEKLEQARGLGASVTLNAAIVNVVKELRRRGGGHAARVTSAAKAAYDVAFPSVRPGGILLVVGLPSESLCFPPLLLSPSEICINASSVGTRQDMRALLAIAAAGKVRCDASTTCSPEVGRT